MKQKPPARLTRLEKAEDFMEALQVVALSIPVPIIVGALLVYLNSRMEASPFSFWTVFLGGVGVVWLMGALIIGLVVRVNVLAFCFALGAAIALPLAIASNAGSPLLQTLLMVAGPVTAVIAVAKLRGSEPRAQLRWPSSPVLAHPNSPLVAGIGAIGRSAGVLSAISSGSHRLSLGTCRLVESPASRRGHQIFVAER